MLAIPTILIELYSALFVKNLYKLKMDFALTAIILSNLYLHLKILGLYQLLLLYLPL